MKRSIITINRNDAAPFIMLFMTKSQIFSARIADFSYLCSLKTNEL